MTPLDAAHAATLGADEAEGPLMRYYAVLAETELFLMLEREAEGDSAEPVTADPGSGPVALAFDLPERLSSFAGRPVPYLALPGREAAAMLASAGLGLALNLGEGSETILDNETLDWLSGIEAETEARTARPVAVHMPSGLPVDLLDAIDRKLARAAGIASHAVLVRAEYDDGGQGHLLAIVDCLPDAEGALAAALAEAMAFQGFGAGWLDVAFFDGESDLSRRIEKAGLRFDIPKNPEVVSEPPGMDPDAPPKLR